MSGDTSTKWARVARIVTVDAPLAFASVAFAVVATVLREIGWPKAKVPHVY